VAQKPPFCFFWQIADFDAYEQLDEVRGVISYVLGVGESSCTTGSEIRTPEVAEKPPFWKMTVTSCRSGSRAASGRTVYMPGDANFGSGNPALPPEVTPYHRN